MFCDTVHIDEDNITYGVRYDRCSDICVQSFDDAVIRATAVDERKKKTIRIRETLRHIIMTSIESAKQSSFLLKH